MFKIMYLAVSASALGLVLFNAPSGSLLTGAPQAGKVSLAKAKPNATGTTTANGIRPRGSSLAMWAFVAGAAGGYQGGK